MAVHDALTAAFDGLGRRFGATVLGTLADDETKVGESTAWPWGCYFLATGADHSTAERSATRCARRESATIACGDT